MSTATWKYQHEEFILDPSSAAFWKSKQTLLLSDLHIGKLSHFRKNGVALPAAGEKNNHWVLSGLIHNYKPKRILFLGDISHSEHNDAWDNFCDFMDVYPTIEKILVQGNHDILEDRHYKRAGFSIVKEWIEGPFHFVHDAEDVEPEGYIIQGHIHPAIRLKGAAHQSMKVPCFYFGKSLGILPAFGEFTGYGKIRAKKNDEIYLIADSKVLFLS